jgi:hypothetical protein
MDFKKVISAMKRDSFEEAEALSIVIYNTQKNKTGKLVPVGNWILKDEETIEFIRACRQRTMRMFLVRFQSTVDRTAGYLKNLSIAQEGRIFFMLYDADDRLIGHMGISDIDGQAGVLDNVMRGAEGGDPRLIYFGEVALLEWGFKKLGLSRSSAIVVSYNWLVISLHEEVGYKITEKVALRKREQDGMIFHDMVDKGEANVEYFCTKMLLTKEDFYSKAAWLRAP